VSERYDVYSTTNPADFDSDLQLADGDFGGDLLIDAEGDLETVDGWINLHQAIRRRLGTIKGYLGNFVRDVEGLVQVDHTYGNPAFKYLSEPIDNNTLVALRLGVQECLQEEDRIIVTDVRVGLVPVGNMIRIVIDIDYREAEDSDRTVRLLQTERGLEII
jgi:hypothetical protein